MRLGDIEFRWGGGNKKWELIRWLKNGGKAYCIVIAFFNKHKEGYDMRTVGNRFFADKNAWIVAKHGMTFLDACFDEEEEDQ